MNLKYGIETHLNVIFSEHPALKSVYEKNKSVMGSKLFSSCRTVFELAQGLWYSKANTLVTEKQIYRDTFPERSIDHVSW